jgi:hypothetical protein
VLSNKTQQNNQEAPMSQWSSRVGQILSGMAMVAICMVGGSYAQAAPRKVALLVGVGQYSGNIRSLDGPPHDVNALRDVLIRRWGFAAGDIHTLVDAQASKAAIMAELTALKQRSAAGDDVLVYFSGHGTSALNGRANLPVPHGSGAFVPADYVFRTPASIEGLIVGRTDLVPMLSGLEASGRQLWVISDSCYSGQQVRSVKWGNDSEASLPSRMIPLVYGQAEYQREADQSLADAAPAQTTPYPYKATAYLAASAEGERALDISRQSLARTPTLDGRPHGAFTDALLRVLEGQIPGDLDGDGLLSLNEVHRAISDFMGQRAYGHTPQRLPAVVEDSNGLGNRPVLSARGVAAKSTRRSIEPLRVRVDGLSAAAQKALSGVPDVVLTSVAGVPADVQLKVSPSGGVAVVVASGDAVAQVPSDPPTRLVAQVRQLAWAKHLQALAEQNRRAALPMEIDPSQYGGNFTVGKDIAFVVRPDKAATMVLLNIDSNGKVSVLYPNRPAEMQRLMAGQAQFIPGQDPSQRVKVQEPFGMDFQLAFAFDETPTGLETLVGVREVDPSDPRLSVLDTWLNSMSGKFTFASTSLRTLKKP